MNAGTCWGKNTIDPRGRGVEKPREATLTFLSDGNKCVLEGGLLHWPGRRADSCNKVRSVECGVWRLLNAKCCSEWEEQQLSPKCIQFVTILMTAPGCALMSAGSLMVWDYWHVNDHLWFRMDMQKKWQNDKYSEWRCITSRKLWQYDNRSDECNIEGRAWKMKQEVNKIGPVIHRATCSTATYNSEQMTDILWTMVDYFRPLPSCRTFILCRAVYPPNLSRYRCLV
jgi:hypothetical protein